MTKTVKQECRNCVHLEVQNDRLGRRIVRADTTYKCLCPIPDIPEVPSWLQHFRNLLVINGERSHMRDMWGEDGVDCPLYQERTK